LFIVGQFSVPGANGNEGGSAGMDIMMPSPSSQLRQYQQEFQQPGKLFFVPFLSCLSINVSLCACMCALLEDQFSFSSQSSKEENFLYQALLCF